MMESKETRTVNMGFFRKLIGLIVLAGVHAVLLIWSCLMAVFVHRYRKVCRFQVRYFIDVMANQLRWKKPPSSQSP